MRIKGKLSYMLLLIPVLLFAGVQMFALTAPDSGTPVAGPASHQTTRPYADVLLISDQTLLMMKNIEGIAMNQSESAKPGCASRAVAKSSVIRGCPIVDCAAPPPGCFYQGPPHLGANGCPIDCGTLVCDGSGN